jgi:hypothetical protein
MNKDIEQKETKASGRKHKINLAEFFRNYGALIFVWILLFTILGLPKFSVISSFFQVLFLLAWTYFGHMLVHLFPDDSILTKINPHMFIHHSKDPYPRWFNLVQESFFNFMGFGIILIIQYLFGWKLFSTSIVVATGILYVLIHICDYSLIGNKEHKEHHTYPRCNYAPDFMDVLFDTRCIPDSPYYNENVEIIHSIIAFIITYGLKQYFKWT